MEFAGLQAVNTFPCSGATLERAFTRTSWNGLAHSQLDYVLAPVSFSLSWSVWNHSRWRNSDHYPVVACLQSSQPIKSTMREKSWVGWKPLDEEHRHEYRCQ
eukprot:8827693-Lingulodinium_polyedra.AAC.1